MTDHVREIQAAVQEREHHSEPGEGLSIQHLIERVGLINRIHTALRFSLNVEDIHSLILTTLISRQGLDLTRAFLFVHDEGRQVFRSLAALGASSQEQHERLHQEIAEEEQCLADMVRDLWTLETTADEETLFKTSLRDLSSHSLWITTYQKFNTHNDLFERIRPLELPYAAAPREQATQACARFYKEIFSSETARIVPHERLVEAKLPAALLELLPEESLWTAIRTQKGVRLLLIADKIFDPAPLTALDALHTDWFISQAALALENAEMFKDLESAYQSLRELDQMKSNFLATISHELRTPLTAINGYIQLMLNNKTGPLPSGQKEMLERIRAHSELLTGKVNDLIEIAEIDSGRAQEIALGPVDPLGAIMAVLPRVEARRAHKGVTIEPLVNGAICKVRANKVALERIFFHLLDNAIKFGHPKGHVWIEFETFNHEAHVSIVDDGIGIAQGQLQNIFNTFYQVDNQLTRSYEGLGIGLAVIKKQIDSTGGKIHVQSQPGHGSTFTVIYPLAAPAEAES